jgi:nicotinate-nucleotide pyrophosphorylase (carboxylating)
MTGIDQLIESALAEDIGEGDHTSLACIPANTKGKAQLLIKQEGIIAGLDIAAKVFNKVDPGLKINFLLTDGAYVHKGDVAFIVEGSSISILSSERVVLNFLQRMSGIATYTHHLVSKLEGLRTKILDTRKTSPGLRIIEKMAVKIGGGENHRMGLYDMVMIKDNHVDFAGGIENAINATHKYLTEKNKKLTIEIEARNLDDVKKIITFGGVDIIMLDNFTTEDCQKAVEMIDGKYKTEASGGITESTIRAYAETGVDYISVGALTHQIKSLDMSLKAIK